MRPTLFLTILYVSDLGRSVAFYDSVFGWSKSVDVPVYAEYEVGSGSRLGLMLKENAARFLEPKVAAAVASDTEPRAEIYLQFDNVSEIVGRLDHCGSRCASPLTPRDWGDDVAYYLDPDGYIVAVAQPSDQAASFSSKSLS